MRKYIKKFFIILSIFFIIASIIPYLIPIDLHESNIQKLFIESEYIEIDNTKIHYRTWIPKDKNIAGKVLMLHGLGGSTYSWRNNIDYLKDEGYIVVAADLPGFGYSDKSEGIDHSQKNRSILLWSLLENIELSLSDELKKTDWILLGHSMGGGTVSAMTTDKPNKAEKLILVSGALFDNSPPFVSNILYYPPIKRAIDLAFSNYIIDDVRIEGFLSSAYGREPSKEEIKNHLVPLKIKKVPSFIPDLIRTAKNEPVEKLNNNEVPILYIAGENDTWIPKEDQNKLKRIVPRVEIKTIEGAYHSSMETHSYDFNNILIESIKNNQ